MWLDLAEMRMILDALEYRLVADETVGLPAYRTLLDYFREQVARVQRVKDEEDRMRASDAVEGEARGEEEEHAVPDA